MTDVTEDDLIVALDRSDRVANMDLFSALHRETGVDGFKVGMSTSLLNKALPALNSLDIRVSSVGRPAEIMVDSKLHDVPSTVAGCVAHLCDYRAKKADSPMRISRVTVHASGGERMMEAAVEAADDELDIIAVTSLTHLTAEEVESIYGHERPTDLTRSLVGMARQAGVDGIVCSPEDLAEIDVPSQLDVLTPGIRPEWYGESDDQSRSARPEKAIEAGSDRLIVGRPVYRGDPIENVRRICS